MPQVKIHSRNLDSNFLITIPIDTLISGTEQQLAMYYPLSTYPTFQAYYDSGVGNIKNAIDPPECFTLPTLYAPNFTTASLASSFGLKKLLTIEPFFNSGTDTWTFENGDSYTVGWYNNQVNGGYVYIGAINPNQPKTVIAQVWYADDNNYRCAMDIPIYSSSTASVLVVRNYLQLNGGNFGVNCYKAEYTTSVVAQEVLNFWRSMLGNAKPDDNNPYIDGDFSTTGGGNGTFDKTSDPIPLPGAFPNLTLTRAFVRFWIPTSEQLSNIASWFWGDTIWGALKNWFGDPVSALYDLHAIPVHVPIGGQVDFVLGNVNSGLPSNYASSGYVALDCGELEIKRFSDSALDYSPNTTYQLYLPFVGNLSLDPDEITGHTLKVVYHIEVLSGDLVAFVLIDNNIFYQMTGNCAYGFPLSSESYRAALSSSLSNLATAGALIASSGLTAPAAVGGAMQVVTNVVNSKPQIEHAGSLNTNKGWLGFLTPYLTIKRPRQSMPEGLQRFEGFPTNVTYKLSALTGFTQIEECHIESTSMLKEEIEEMERLLKEGVIL